MKKNMIKKGLVVGMSAILLVSSTAPIPVQAATWKQNKTGWWWQEDDGSYPASEWKTIGGNRYYFDQRGYMKTGWYKEEADWYYLGAASDGAMKTGWQKVNGTWYYMNPDGKMATGWKKIGASWYYLDPSGAMHTGWLKTGNDWYYLGAANDGAMKTGWQQVSGKWYYMNTDGKMAVNTWIGNWYVDGSGAWTKTKQPAKWVKSGNRWWYRHEDGGYTSHGFETIGGQTYYFDASGWMVTGWKAIKNEWYYFNASGAMATNAWIDGNYYVGADGKMAKDTWIGSDYVDGNGKWVPNKKKEEVSLESISLSQELLDMWVGDSTTLEVTYNPSNTTVDKNVTWSSENNNVVTVEDGTLKAVGKGETTITAKVAGKEASCEVKVAEEYKILNNGIRDFLPVGGSWFISVRDQDGDLPLNEPDYEVSDESVATLKGGLTGVSEGTVTLTANVGGRMISQDIEVKKVEKIREVYFDPGTYTMKIGEKLQLQPTVVPDNSLYYVQLGSWTSSNPEVAVVDFDGVVRTVGTGETEITGTVAEEPVIKDGPGGETYHTVRCTIKVDGVGDNTELEKIEWNYSNDTNKRWEYANVGDIVTPNIQVYPVTYSYDIKDVKASVVWSGHNNPGETIQEDGIVEIVDGNKIKACKPGEAIVKISLGGKEIEVMFFVSENQ